MKGSVLPPRSVTNSGNTSSCCNDGIGSEKKVSSMTSVTSHESCLKDTLLPSQQNLSCRCYQLCVGSLWRCMARTRLYSAIYHKYKMSMTSTGSLSGAAAESAWILPAQKKKNRRPKSFPDPEAKILSESLRRCAIAEGEGQSQAPVWMRNLQVRPRPEFALGDGHPQQHILLLVGVPGSGKSTLAETLCRVLPWKYQRVNQDLLGHRNACLRLTQSILDDGCCPVIDRCNVSRGQRNYFTEFRVADAPIPVDCLVLQSVSVSTCIRRCKERGMNHPTLKPNDVNRVMRLLQSEWEAPSLNHEPKLRSVTTITSKDMLHSVVLKLIEDAVAETSAPKEEEAQHNPE